MTQATNGNRHTRRTILGGAAALAAGSVLPSRVFANDDAQSDVAVAKPNSVFSGVRIGAITYSYRGEAKSAEDTLKCLVEDGLSETELMGGPIYFRWE